MNNDNELCQGIFNISDVSDLPEQLRNELQSIKPENLLSMRIYDLVKQSNEGLIIDQIHAAFFRKHGEVLDRSKLRSTLNNLCRTGKLLKYKNSFEVNHETK